MQARRNNNNNVHRTRNRISHKLSNLPIEVLFSICLVLDFESIFKMQFTSKRMAKRISHMLKNMDFWNTKTSLDLSKEQIAIIRQSQSGYNSLLSISADVFEKNLSQQSIYYKKSSIVSFFKAKHSYGNLFVAFDLEDVQSLILKDKASTLLRKVSRVGDIIPFIQEDNFDLGSVFKIIEKFDADVGVFSVGDAAFIGLLPGIIKFRAQQCFDLFIQAFLALHSVFPVIGGVSGFSINDVITIISGSSKENDFINRFIELTIKLYPADRVHLYQVIEYACKNDFKKVIYDSFASISPHRKSAIVSQWNKLDLYSSLIRELFIKEECRHNMKDALKKALEFIESNPDLEIDDLIKFQKVVNTSFDSSIEVLTIPAQTDYVNSNMLRR